MLLFLGVSRVVALFLSVLYFPASDLVDLYIQIVSDVDLYSMCFRRSYHFYAEEAGLL